jgi:hypothetical protein
MTASATVVQTARALPLGMLPPEIPPYQMTARVPIIPTRPNRGPKSGPLKSSGFLMGDQTPLPPGRLPVSFTLPARDHSMEPLLSKGDGAIFSTELVPAEGDCVLIGTTFGPDIRQYHQVSDTEWAGCALHSEYEHIRSVEEPMWIMAVLIGIQPGEELTVEGDHAQA